MDDKQSKFARFTRKGLYDFKLDDTSFKIFLDPDNGGVDYEIFAEQNFEPGVLRIIRESLTKKEDPIFVDIGANIGQHSIFASLFSKKVYSFEPINRIYNQFQQSIFANNIFNIVPINYALGNKKEELPIYSNEINVGASSVFVKDGGRKFLQNIKVERLDDIYQKVGIERVDFAKIDVEGFELNVLEGAKELFNRFKPTTLIELTPFFYNKIDPTITKKIYDFFVNLGYKLYDVGNNGETFIEVTSFDQVKDLDQTNLFCVHE